MAGTKRVLIDTDPGTDDAIALLMALEARRLGMVDLLGISTVGGNARLGHTTHNALAVLEYAGGEEIPVAAGASRPLKGKFPYAYQYHGPAGLSVRLPAPRSKPVSDGATEFLRHVLLAYEDGPITEREGTTLVALGPLTNIAKLLQSHPLAAGPLSGLIVMGGALDVPGNVTPHAEFNFYSDPSAARVVLSSGAHVTLVDLGVCRQALIQREEVDRLLKGDRAGRLAGRILSNWFRQHPEKEGYDLCDPVAMAVALEPGILTTRNGRVHVETGCPKRLGQTTFEAGEGSVEVATAVDAPRFFELFYRLLT